MQASHKGLIVGSTPTAPTIFINRTIMESKQGSIFEAAAQLLEKIRNGESLSETELAEAAVSDDESMRDAIKKILPKNDVTNVFGTIEWRKKGGSAGAKTLDTIKTKLMAIGFKKQNVGSKSTPTGSAVGFTATLVHPLGWKATFKQHYGSQPIYIASIEKDTQK